jgi:hypothetical protein
VLVEKFQNELVTLLIVLPDCLVLEIPSSSEEAVNLRKPLDDVLGLDGLREMSANVLPYRAHQKYLLPFLDIFL